MRRIAAKHHSDVDTSRDYEYTDWDDVKAFAREFERRVLAAAPVQKAG
jgi:menaquinone-dependent protoporphyrinogen oxidase